MRIITPSATFTRPANITAYTTGDLVANSETAASVTPLEWAVGSIGGAGIIRGVRLYKSTATATLATFNLHLFTASPGVPTNGDNGAFAIASAVDYLGEIAIDMATVNSPGTAYLFRGVTAAIPFNLYAASASLFGLLEAGAGYTPASAEIFKVTLDIEGG